MICLYGVALVFLGIVFLVILEILWDGIKEVLPH